MLLLLRRVCGFLYDCMMYVISESRTVSPSLRTVFPSLRTVSQQTFAPPGAPQAQSISTPLPCHDSTSPSHPICVFILSVLRSHSRLVCIHLIFWFNEANKLKRIGTFLLLDHQVWLQQRRYTSAMSRYSAYKTWLIHRRDMTRNFHFSISTFDFQLSTDIRCVITGFGWMITTAHGHSHIHIYAVATTVPRVATAPPFSLPHTNKLVPLQKLAGRQLGHSAHCYTRLFLDWLNFNSNLN